jgi:hypothetical protein
MSAKVQPKQLVAAPSNMSDEYFRLHMNHRHSDSLSDGDIPEANFTFDVAQPYRAFHRQLHRTRVDLEHEHSPEPPEASVVFALQCLRQNHFYGWREIAGTKGVVSAFPDGSYAVRFGQDKARYYNEPDKVAEILMKGRHPKQKGSR